MIQVGEVYRNVWGVIVRVTAVKEDCVFLEFLQRRSDIVGVKSMDDFKQYYTKLSSLEVELL